MRTNLRTNLFGFLILSSVAITGCSDDDGGKMTSAEAYIRVLDIQHPEKYIANETYLSVFKFDNAYYGNKALDSVETPKFEVKNFGDFILGRFRTRYLSFEDQASFFRGGIDYYSNEAVLDNFDYNPDRDFFYRSGLAPGRGVYFPNLSHRSNVGRVINGIDYYKWASFPSGAHAVSFEKIHALKKPGEAFYNYRFTQEDFVAAQLYFEPNAYYTLALCNLDRGGSDYRVLSIKEDPYAQFDPHKSYVRFINAIEIGDDPVLESETESIDIYAVKAGNGLIKSLLKGIPFGTLLDLKSLIGEETLIASDLKRFHVSGEIDYFEMDFSEFFAKNDTSYIGKDVTPSYVFLVYPHGESAATGAKPLLPLSQIFSNIAGLGIPWSQVLQRGNCENAVAPLISNGKQYHPTISTVFIGADKIYYNLEQAEVRQLYMDRFN